jgi:xanthine dehydrogenase accessory factor
LAGTVGGGITELKVIELSQAILESKKSALFTVNLGGDLNKGSDSICGGSMTILLDASPELHLPVFMQVKKSLEERRMGVLMTLVDQTNPENRSINRLWITTTGQLQLPEDLKQGIEPVIDEMLQNTRTDSCYLPGTNNIAFLECILPQPSLVIAGAGHIGQSLAKLGKFLGFEVTVWDDRPEYADQAKIPDAHIVLSGATDSDLEQLNILNDTYLVIVTRGHKSDCEILRKFIGTDAAYVGMIGSKAKVSQLKSSFLENGWATTGQWDRIFTPIGLDIGAQSVEEIALSIAAQLVKVRNQKNNKDE